MTHAITNNPNDQIRPEDYENEAATGRKPAYIEIEHPDHPGDSEYGLWVARYSDFTGSGEFLPSYYLLDGDGNFVLDENGDPIVNVDDDGNPIGTIFREISPDNYATQTLTSSDLEFGYTDAWYTTMDRDPFEAVLDGNGDYIVGPRWRLKSNKFGQDLPGVEIPLIPHSEPPFTKDNIKYEVGELTTTTINLLDWAAGEDSPLRYSNGWISADPTLVNQNGVTVNGLRLSDKFDVAFYVKGDAKATQIYDVKINITYVDPTPDGLTPIVNPLALVRGPGAANRVVSVPLTVATSLGDGERYEGLKFTDRGNEDHARLFLNKVAAPVLQLADSVQSDSTVDNARFDSRPVVDIDEVHEFDVEMIDELFAADIEFAL